MVESSVSTKYNYNMVSVVKLVAAILVVMIHTMALVTISEDLWVGTSLAICRIAVPFFFIVTGYFFYGKSSEAQWKKIKKYTGFFFKAVLIEAVIGIAFLINILTAMPLLLFIKMLLLIGLSGSLWYVSSMVIGLVFIKPFLKGDRYKVLIVISIIFFMFGLMGDSYYGLFKDTFMNTPLLMYKNFFVMMQVGFTCSVPFLTMGLLMKKFNVVEKMKKPGLYFSFGMILLLIEAFILYKTKIAIDYNMYFSLLIATPALFVWAMKSKIKIKDNHGVFYRRMSVFIYILHQAILSILYVTVPNIMTNSVVKFVLALTIALVLGTILIKVKFYKFLKI